MTFNVTILGSNSAIPTLKRNPTAQVVNHADRLFLIDCAEGTQVQLRKNKIKIQRINHIFISHLHGDHFFGLIGLISSMHLLGRVKELNIFGPAQLEEILNLQLKASQTELNYPMVFHPTEPSEHKTIYEDQKLIISTIPLNHRIPTCGFLFQEKQGKRRVKKEKIKNLDIPVDQLFNIRNGEDFKQEDGTSIDNTEITDPPRKIRSYAFCSDTSYFEPIIPIIKGADLLYHETTFMQDRAQAAADKFHTTTIEAATIAKKAGVKRMIIGHFSNRYDDPNLLLDEARTVFKNTQLAMDGRVFEV